tara:strand:- start:160 stop:456 length:297 start_codon:yes stop_codon:yes gene_type:complete
MIDQTLEKILDSIDGKNCDSSSFWIDCEDSIRYTSVSEFLEDLEYYVHGYSEWNHMRNPDYMKEEEDLDGKQYKELLIEKKNMQNYLKKFKKAMKVIL